MKPPICYICYRGDAPGPTTLDRVVNAHLGSLLTGPAAPNGSAGVRALVPGGVIVLSAMPFPYPAGELVDDLAQRGAWPTWREDCRAWRSHLILAAILTDRSFAARDMAANALRTASVVASHTGADAVGWSGNLLFHRADQFAAAVARAPLPVDILVRCLWRGRPGPAGAGLGARTRGLDAFALPEIDHPPTGEDIATIYTRLMNLSSYLLANGMVLNDGDTIGTDARASMRVAHGRDDQGRLVLTLQQLPS